MIKTPVDSGASGSAALKYKIGPARLVFFHVAINFNCVTHINVSK